MGWGSGELWGAEGGFLLAGQSSATSLECRPPGHAKLMTSRSRNALAVSSGGPPGGVLPVASTPQPLPHLPHYHPQPPPLPTLVPLLNLLISYLCLSAPALSVSFRATPSLCLAPFRFICLFVLLFIEPLLGMSVSLLLLPCVSQVSKSTFLNLHWGELEVEILVRGGQIRATLPILRPRLIPPDPLII